jgi:hypothetical protein
MNLTASIFKRLLKRKIATAVLLSASLAAFAALGDGGKKLGKNNSLPLTLCSKNFSLRSGYNYKSNNPLATPEPKQFILLNTVATFQKGNATYVLPLKKKLLLDKIKFNPAAQ